MLRPWWKSRPLAKDTSSLDPMNRALEDYITGTANPPGGHS